MYLLRYLLFACLFASTAPRALAQTDFGTVKKRDRETLRKTRQYFDFREYAEAKAGLDELTEKYPRIPLLWYMRSGTHRGLGNLDAAISDLRRGMEVDPEEDYRTYGELGQLLSLQRDYAGAASAYRRFRNLLPASAPEEQRRKADQQIATAELAMELMKNPVPFVPERLSGGVNTPDNQEYFPSLSIDGKRLLFTRNLRNQNEDFYESTELADGSWSPARPLDGVNTDLNEAAQTITADGRLLVFTACDRRDGLGGCDLYYSEHRDGRWTPARNLGEPVNSRFRETQPSLSSDGRLLFFASIREGGLGKHDIYVSGRRADGSWSAPVNLGPTVNTPEDDTFPFWAADGKTLFFTSTGHPGLGGADLFRTTLEDDKWTAPANLGYPINTEREETNLFITLDGRTAYYSAGERGGIAGTGADVDIYRFELPPAIRPTPATYVAATVTDAVTGGPLSATVRLEAATGDALRRTTSARGEFLTVLPAGRDYSFTVEQPGYLFYSDRFSLGEGFAPDEPYTLDIRLQPVGDKLDDFAGAEADGAIVLKNVFFETGRAELLETSTNELDRLVGLLTDQPALRVEIAGHTDNVGDEAANQLLSEERAAAVRAYLLDNDIAADRVTTVGYGETRPVETNDTEAGRAGNRRTTFRLLR